MWGYNTDDVKVAVPDFQTNSRFAIFTLAVRILMMMMTTTTTTYADVC